MNIWIIRKYFLHGKHIFIVLIITCLILICCQNESPKRTTKLIIKTAQVKEKPILNQKIIDIIPFNGISNEIVQNLFNRLKLVCPNVVLRNSIELPTYAYYHPRNRYKADNLISFLAKISIKGHINLGITDRDISSSMHGVDDYGVMGLSYMPGRACVVSTFRLKKNNLYDQFFKVAIHELGHTQGLDHCANKTCFMRDAEGKNTTDQEKEFCPKCKDFLIGKGCLIK